MPRSNILLFASAIVMGVTFVAHANEPAAPAANEAVTAAAPEKKICKEQNRTGSRISKGRVCKTAAEWEAIKRADGKGVDEMFDTKGVGSVSEKLE